MNNLPSGTVTFLFTDIEGSTRLAQQYPNDMPALLARHHEILHQSIREQNGYVFQIIGDALCVAFSSVIEAVNAAVNAQRSLFSEPWEPAPIKVRMGIHTGTAEIKEDGQYNGYATMASTQRIMSAGHGRQILLSGATYELVQDTLPADTELQDMGEKRLKDLLRPEHLYQLNIAGLATSFPPLKTLDSFPNNLPTQLTSFIGRENEIAEVKHKLELHRLVTLTGSGGTGKTRLSLQVAADLLEKFDHGVWFIELAPLTDPDLIPQTILSAIGIQDQQGKAPLDVLKEYLHEKQTLVVLDNCEHLIEASARVSNTLLNSAPKLKILASSREALGIKGEASYPVPSLSLPDLKHLPALEGLSQYEAVRLFIDRALLIAPHFMVDQNSAPFIAQICYRLDGIPLAIELAAARVKILSVEQISKRLDDRFRLLTGGARTSLPRQQTLRALIDWSYDLLAENERLLLRRLSVFAGGWTLEAAEEVCSDQAPIDSEQTDHRLLITDILDLLSQLVNKSLVIVIEHSQSGEIRYRMLETIRQYAREKLLDSGAGVVTQQKHAGWFLVAAEQVDRDFTIGQNLTHLLRKFESDHENFRSALTWFLDQEQLEDYAQLAAHLGMPWLELTFYHEALQWLEPVLLHRDVLSSKVIAQTLEIMSRALARTGNYELAITYGKESIELIRQSKEKNKLALALDNLGDTFSEYGDSENANKCYDEALVLYRELGDKIGISYMLIETGWEQVTLGNFREGLESLEEALKMKRALKEDTGIAYALFVLGTCRWHNKEYEKSEQALKESIKLHFDLGNIWFGNACLYILAGIASARKLPRQAAKYMGVADKVIGEIRGIVPPFWDHDVRVPILSSVHEQMNKDDYDKAYAEGYSMTLEQAIAFTLDLAND